MTGSTTGMVGERETMVENEMEIGMEKGGSGWKTFLDTLLGS